MWVSYEMLLAFENQRWPNVKALGLSVQRSTGNILEAKSVKLYLMSLNAHLWKHIDHTSQSLIKDTNDALRCKKGEVRLEWDPVRYLYDDLPQVSSYLMTRCPITDQPDFADVLLMSPRKVIPQSVLDDIVLSFYGRQMFQEDLADQLYVELEQLALGPVVVGCLFMRRGGIEINSWRWNSQIDYFPKHYRSPRQ